MLLQKIELKSGSKQQSYYNSKRSRKLLSGLFFMGESVQYESKHLLIPAIVPSTYL